MGAVESRFADIIWQNEPILSAELAKRSEEQLKWKKSTTYTVLKRLCDKGIFVNNGGTVKFCDNTKKSGTYTSGTLKGSWEGQCNPPF